MPIRTQDKPDSEFKLGDRVKIKNYGGDPGKIVELRGPLGPRGVNIYRVAIPQKPGVFLVEVRGDQLKLSAPTPRKRIVLKAMKSKTARKRIVGGHGPKV